MSAVTSGPRPLSSALLLQLMSEHYRAGRERDTLAHVTVIEDAHRLPGRPGPGYGDSREAAARARATAAFAHTVLENRRYGEGIVLVEQVPSKLVDEAFVNINVKIVHRLPAEVDRRALSPGRCGSIATRSTTRVASPRLRPSSSTRAWTSR